ncbi:MAG TPA: hypothetical protein VIV40_26910 [Kofleriaceae bacterium]
MRRALLAVALATTLGGCSKILGIDDVTHVDGGAPPNTVIGRRYARYRTEAGPTDVPIDISSSIIKAMIPDATQPTGFRLVDGVGNADGTFSINPVPDGAEYYLRIDRDYFVTTQHNVDFHIEYPLRGSPAPAGATSTTTINFNVTGMTPWRGNNAMDLDDQLEIDSFALMYTGNSAAADSSLVWNASYDWTTGFGGIGGPPPLPDASQGDDLWLLHLRPSFETDQFSITGRKHRTLKLIDVFNPPAQTLMNGSTTTISGAFKAVPADHMLGMSFMRGLFDTGFDSMTELNNAVVSLHANPVPNDFGAGALLASVEFNDWSRSTSGSESLSVKYGDPFPASWTRILDVSYNRLRWVQMPGTSARYVAGWIFRTTLYAGGGATVSPTLAPPANVKIAGKPGTAGGLIAFDAVTPTTVSWNAVAGAKSYTVILYRVYANGSTTRTAYAATFTTTGTSIQVPADALTGGEFFAFVVSADQFPSDFSAGELATNGVPNQSAATPTGMFRFSSTCGNGDVESGEQCDTKGESASCDIDCTFVVCGDGLRNAAAGEPCDTIRDTDGCDSDCTLPACGDGHVNTATEDCDDGNAVDNGNGCSAQCKFNNFCGDSQVQNVAELCDTGGDSATCDSDCTDPVCGDGHLNTMANEQCDDGNTDDTDRCTTSCMIN